MADVLYYNANVGVTEKYKDMADGTHARVVCAEVIERKYIATLTQENELDPVATIVHNTLGEITWTRDSAGVFLGTSDGLFKAGKTTFSISDMTDIISIEIINSDVVKITAEDDGLLTDRIVEIYTYL